MNAMIDVANAAARALSRLPLAASTPPHEHPIARPSTPAMRNPTPESRNSPGAPRESDQYSLRDRARKTLVVELGGFEPPTFSLRTRRATNCAIAPRTEISIASPPTEREPGGRGPSCQACRPWGGSGRRAGAADRTTSGMGRTLPAASWRGIPPIHEDGGQTLPPRGRTGCAPGAASSVSSPPHHWARLASRTASRLRATAWSATTSSVERLPPS